MQKVKEKSEVVWKAKQDGKVVHFGALMQLCHLKNSELDEIYQSYKGRLVFRGDNVKDQEGEYAVFTEQGTASSHMTAIKFLEYRIDKLINSHH